MPVNKEKYQQILLELKGKAELIAVSKTKSPEHIQALYDLGQRDFGENYVQELMEKQEKLPGDIRWHFIGHLQKNKVKYIASFIHLIQSVDSFALLKEINKQALKNDRIIHCLLQIHIAREETKFGLDINELKDLVNSPELNTLKNIKITGLMGMASFSNDENLIRTELMYLKKIFDKNKAFSFFNYQLSTLSMGMSGDYKIALEEGSNLVRIGSLLFGNRN